MGIKKALALLFVLMASVAAADTLWLRNGEIIDGKIERKDAQNIYFKTLDGESRVIALTDVISSDTDEELSGSTTSGPGNNASPPSEKVASPPPVETAEAKKTDKPVAAEPAKPALKKMITIDMGGGVKMQLVLISPGSFQMGSKDGFPNEKPVHKVNISKPFYMGKFEVTQAQWGTLMGDYIPSQTKGARCPVDSASWLDSQKFLQKLNELKKGPGTFRLPTEAEWEYACRAGSKTRYNFGNSDAQLCKYGNYCDRSNTAFWIKNKDYGHNDGSDMAAPVGSFPPNKWGLYDMHGNAKELCQDFYAEKYTSDEQTDPVGPASGHDRVMRGGSYLSPPADCRSARREGVGETNHFAGLRVVCTVGDQ